MKLAFLRDLFCWSLTKIQCSHQLCCASESGGWGAEAAHTRVPSTQSYTQQHFDVQQCHMAQHGLLIKRCGCCYLDCSITVVWQGRSECPWISHSISKGLTSEEIKMSSALCKVTQNGKNQEQKLTIFRNLSNVARSILWFVHDSLRIYTQPNTHPLTKLGQEVVNIFKENYWNKLVFFRNFTCTYISSWEMLELQAMWMSNIT